jgi:branched-chain amino acid transport system ATP-binding protein
MTRPCSSPIWEPTMLSVRGLDAGYGSLKVLRDLTLDVPAGRIVALLGGNGAGKTTTMHVLTGIIPNTRGDILFEGKRIDRMTSDQIFRQGIALVAQGRQLFPEMTVRENLEMGAISTRSHAETATAMAEMFALFPRLREREDQRAASLSGGEQQMLATGRALMSRPRLLLLDEPTTGLAPIIVKELTRVLRGLNANGLTILIVEQNVRMALKLADEVYIMRSGEIVMQAPSSNLQDSDEMFKSYLG